MHPTVHAPTVTWKENKTYTTSGKFNESTVQVKLNIMQEMKR